MQVTETERIQELQTAIALQTKEIQDLTKQKQLLQSELLNSDPTLENDPFLASFPVIRDYIEGGKKSIQNISAEQVVHVLSQLHIPDRAITNQNSTDTAEVKGLECLIEKNQEKYALCSSKLQELLHRMGPNSMREGQQLQRQGIPPLDQLIARKALVRREIRTGNLLREEKGATIKKLSEIVKRRCSLVDEIDEVYNQLRVIDCDTAIEMEKIERLNAELEDVDACLERKRQESELVPVFLIKQDTMHLNSEKNEVANSQRIPQERVIKAQDYRLAQLERRLSAVEKTLQNIQLKSEVHKILTSKWNANTIDVSNNREDLYDIEQIIPTQEKVHPGVYNLFLNEKERASRTLSLLNIGTKEKEEVVASQVCKLEALCREFNLVLEELDDLIVNATHIEEEEQKRYLAFIQEQRAYIYNLTHQKKQYLSRSVHR